MFVVVPTSISLLLQVCAAIYDVARSFNSMYSSGGHPIMSCPDVPLRAARLQLTSAVLNSLDWGLEVLGIEKLETM